MSGQTLELSVISRWYRAAGPFLTWHIPQAIRIAGSPLRSLSVVVANDPLMKRLHQQYFNDPSLTDVITFPLELDKKGRALSGELYLGLSVARRQAAARHLRVQHELLLYAVHGILHLGGYDDQTERGYARMHKEEDHILERLGIGAAFARPELGRRNKPQNLTRRKQ